MLVVMRRGATAEEVQQVCTAIEEMGFQARPMPGAGRTSIGVVGNDGRVDASRIVPLSGVQECIHVSKPYKQVSREWKSSRTVVTFANGASIGGDEIAVMAGPCSVEGESLILDAAHAVKAAGAGFLRGGAFKPRSSPYSFQGLGITGLQHLATAREATGLQIITEAMDPEGLAAVADMADIVQLGARNMQNYSLLKLAGKCGKPVLLKRGLSATIQELLLSAEYILDAGNPDVILCERGIRSFDTATRNCFDLAAIAVVHQLSHLPIVADPSHGTGHRAYVPSMARASIAAGADGLLIEVHPTPERAMSDGAQTVSTTEFTALMRDAAIIATAVGRSLAPALK